MPDPIYKIAKWREVFETADSRRHKVLTWVSMPVDMNSNGFLEMFVEFGERAAAIYGAWCATVAVAASCNVRGVLATSAGQGLSPARMELLTRFPAALFDDLFRWASSDKVNWLQILTLDEFTRLAGSDTDSDTQKHGENGQTTGDWLRNDRRLVEKRATQPHLTQPNQTKPHPTSPHPTRWSGIEGLRDEVFGLGVEFEGGPLEWWEGQLKAFRRLSRSGEQSIPTGLVVALIGLSWASGDNDLLACVQERLRSGDVRSPKRYVEASVRRALEGTGVEVRDVIDIVTGLIRSLKNEVAA